MQWPTDLMHVTLQWSIYSHNSRVFFSIEHVTALGVHRVHLAHSTLKHCKSSYLLSICSCEWRYVINSSIVILCWIWVYLIFIGCFPNTFWGVFSGKHPHIFIVHNSNPKSGFRPPVCVIFVVWKSVHIYWRIRKLKKQKIDSTVTTNLTVLLLVL